MVSGRYLTLLPLTPSSRSSRLIPRSFPSSFSNHIVSLPSSVPLTSSSPSLTSIFLFRSFHFFPYLLFPSLPSLSITTLPLSLHVPYFSPYSSHLPALFYPPHPSPSPHPFLSLPIACSLHTSGEFAAGDEGITGVCLGAGTDGLVSLHLAVGSSTTRPNTWVDTPQLDTCSSWTACLVVCALCVAPEGERQRVKS